MYIIFEGNKQSFNSFCTSFTAGKPLKNLKLTLNYYENIIRISILQSWWIWFCVYIHTAQSYCHSHTNWGPLNGFQRLLIPGYCWKTVEKPETDPKLSVNYYKNGIVSSGPRPSVAVYRSFRWQDDTCWSKRDHPYVCTRIYVNYMYTHRNIQI